MMCRCAVSLLVVLAACTPNMPAASPDRSSPPAPRPAAGTGPLVIGHRGASGYAPEHTLAAYDLAVEMGADFIEQDLQMTRDGVLVVLHDPTLERTARGPAENCTGGVIEKTLAQLRTCDVGSWFNERFPEGARPEFVGLRIPTLDEVFERYRGRARFYVETKHPEEAPGMEEELLRLLEKHRLGEPADGLPRVLIQSFSPASLRRVHAAAPDLLLVQLFSSRESSSSIRRQMEEASRYASGIGPDRRDVDAELIAAARTMCLDVHPYTVNEPAEMETLLALGVGGMFTDYPDRLTQLLQRQKRRGSTGSGTQTPAC